MTVSMARSGDLPGWITLVGLVTKPSVLPIRLLPKSGLPTSPPEKRVKNVPDSTSPGEEPGRGRLSSLFSLNQFIVNQALTLNNFSLVPQPSFCSFV